MGKGLRSQAENKLLNKLVSDCITFRLKESDALDYIEKVFGESISKRAYWDRRRRLISDNSKNNAWLSWFSRAGFLQSHIRHIEDMERIHNDSMHRLYELTNRTDVFGKPLPRDENLILKLKDNIFESLKILVELETSTPYVSEINNKHIDARVYHPKNKDTDSSLADSYQKRYNESDSDSDDENR